MIFVRDALDDHLRRALENAFPASRDGGAVSQRTRALLALREMCDADGRRTRDIPASTLERALGDGSAEMIERLVSPTVRLIVPQDRPDGSIWFGLPHDSLAEVVTRAFEQESVLRQYAIDRRLFDLWRLVTQRSEDHARTGDTEALNLTRGQTRLIERHAATLLLDSARRAWWDLARARRQRRDWRLAAVAAIVLIAAGAMAAIVWRLRADPNFNPTEARRQQLLAGLNSADPGQVLASLNTLIRDFGASSSEVVDLLNRRTRRDTLTTLIEAPRRLPDGD
ncbi:MAG: hypothetical protein QM736_02695 [Vicinamibacterales bacterium]